MGNNIQDMFKDALTNMDFKRLNNEITASVNAALADVRTALGIQAEGDKLKGDVPKPGTWRPAGSEKAEDPAALRGRPDRPSPYNAQAQAPRGGRPGGHAEPAVPQQSQQTRRPGAAAQNFLQQKRTGQQPLEPQVPAWRNWSKPAPPAHVVSVSQPGRQMSRGLRIPYAPKGRVAGALAEWTGGFSCVGLSLVLLSILSDFIGFGGYYVVSNAFLISSMWLASFGLFMAGRRLRKRNRRARIYHQQLQYRGFCSFSELSGAVGESKRFVAKDVKKMLSIGMFPEGHLEPSGTYLMGTRAVYDQHAPVPVRENDQKLLEDNRRLQEEQERLMRENHALKDRYEKRLSVAEDPYRGLSPEVREAVVSGRSQMRQIKEVNEATTGEEMSVKLDRLELVVDRILYHVEKHPKKLEEIRKFMDYYLPTTLKLVVTYKDFDSQPVQGENILTAKEEIMKTLDTINYAFEKLLDSMFEDAAMDVSTDISVLETMFAQEGLTEDDFMVSQKENHFNL